MIKIENRRDQKIALFGLGSSGLTAARALAASGATILAWDDSAIQRKKAKEEAIPLQDLYSCDFGDIDALIVAPGIPLTHHPHTIVKKARVAKRPIIGDIELLIEACPTNQFIGITGTNGKSTTTALLGHILNKAGIKTQIGGNIGPPALGFHQPDNDEIIVLELSSFQLDLTKNATFDIAAFLNLSPDHLDRHGNMSNYLNAKRQIFRDRKKTTNQQVAIIGVDDEFGRSLYKEFSANPLWKTLPISGSKIIPNGFYVINGNLYDTSGVVICDLGQAKNLLGIHNWQNAATAGAIGHVVGINNEIIAQAMYSYQGLPHRMEDLGSINNIQFINDSKATNCESTARALACFENIFWIAGGLAKKQELTVLEPYLSKIQHAFLIGDSAKTFASVFAGKINITQCRDLKTATQEAFRAAATDISKKPTILLSPACASFDQWNNFEARGDAFKSFVTSLLGNLE